MSCSCPFILQNFVPLVRTISGVDLVFRKGRQRETGVDLLEKTLKSGTPLHSVPSKVTFQSLLEMTFIKRGIIVPYPYRGHLPGFQDAVFLYLSYCSSSLAAIVLVAASTLHSSADPYWKL